MSEKRKDSKGRILKTGESERKDGVYMYRYNDAFGKRVSIYAGTLSELREKEAKAAEDFNISLDDYDTRNGYYYEYELRATSDTEILETVKVATICSFDGLLISDDTGIWVSSFGTSESEYKCAFKKNANVVYVKTLRGKFPYAFVNAEDNYYTGSVTALFVSLDDKGCPSFDDANVYRQTFIDFLCNGQTKLFKTDDGRIMKIAIDAGIQEDTNKISKLSTVTFNWTQVGEVDA